MPSVTSTLSGRKASDWSRPFPYQREGSELPKGQYQSAMDTLTEYTCLSISPAFPRVRVKPDHVSSQGKEAIFVTHDTLPQAVKVSTLYYKKTYLQESHIYTY